MATQSSPAPAGVVHSSAATQNLSPRATASAITHKSHALAVGDMTILAVFDRTGRGSPWEGKYTEEYQNGYKTFVLHGRAE